MAYSIDLRKKALEALEKGFPRTVIRNIFGIGINTLKTWENLKAETGSLENKPLDRKARKIGREELLEYYRLNPFSTNKETAVAFNCSVSGIRSAKKVLGITRKKKTKQYSERDEQERERFIDEINSLPVDSELHYADESGFVEYYTREYGYALRGEKVIGEVSGKHYARTSIVAAMSAVGIIAPFAFKGSMNSALFEGWMEQVYIPSLENPMKSVLIIDNAPFHNKPAIEDIANEYGIKVIFLPAYSPDLNPIENFWANVKKRLRYNLHKFATFWDGLVHAFH
jgi:transposase